MFELVISLGVALAALAIITGGFALADNSVEWFLASCATLAVGVFLIVLTFLNNIDDNQESIKSTPLTYTEMSINEYKKLSYESVNCIPIDKIEPAFNHLCVVYDDSEEILFGLCKTTFKSSKVITTCEALRPL